MKDTFTTIANSNNWGMLYARRDFQNLFDEEPEEQKVYLFLDPIKRGKTFGDYNQVTSKTYTGSFMLVMSSNLDEIDYQTRFDKYIKPIINKAESIILEYIRCNTDIVINSYDSTEVINTLDYNTDGIVVSFSASEDV